MVSGDGLLVRVRAAARTLKAGQVRALARLAQVHGNGVVEVTQRGNLQLRGVADADMPAVQAGLVAAGLADPARSREARPALEVDPLDGLDPTCAPLVEIAAACEALLATEPDVLGLSPKLAIVLDGGSGAMRDLRGDVRIDVGSSPVVTVGVETPDGPVPLVSCEPGDAVAVLRVLIRALAALADEPRRPRMRDLVASRGLAALRADVTHLAHAPVASSPGPARPLIGFHVGTPGWLGIGVPFGSAPAAVWEGLADVAERCGDGALRTAPSRTVLLPGVTAAVAPGALADARALGLCTRADDPRLRMVACVGAPGCSSAHGATRSLATALAERIASGATLHVSGCAKGCASGAAADVTVVLVPDGVQVGFGLDVRRTALTAPVPRAALAGRLDARAAESVTS
jgi:precorrin-3B synthase